MGGGGNISRLASGSLFLVCKYFTRPYDRCVPVPAGSHERPCPTPNAHASPSERSGVGLTAINKTKKPTGIQECPEHPRHHRTKTPLRCTAPSTPTPRTPPPPTQNSQPSDPLKAVYRPCPQSSPACLAPPTRHSPTGSARPSTGALAAAREPSWRTPPPRQPACAATARRP